MGPSPTWGASACMKRVRFGALRNRELPRAWHRCFLLQPPQRCSAGHQALLHDVTATTAVRAVKKGRLHSQATNTPPDCLSSCSPVAKSYPQRNLRAAFPLHTIALLTPYTAARAPGGLRGGGSRFEPRSMLFAPLDALQIWVCSDACQQERDGLSTDTSHFISRPPIHGSFRPSVPF